MTGADGAPPDGDALHHVAIVGGHVVIGRTLYDAYLNGVGAVGLIERDGVVLLVPLARSSPGGLLLKMRNLRGDCVVAAHDFLRSRNIPDSGVERTCPVRWREDLAALAIDGLLKAVAAPT